MNTKHQALWALGLAAALAGCQTTATRSTDPATQPSPDPSVEEARDALLERPRHSDGTTQLEPPTPNARLKRDRLSEADFERATAGADALARAAPFTPRALRPKEMAVHAIDVGQGDAFLLEFACGAALVDTGLQRGQASRDRLVAYVDRFFDQRRPDLHRTLQLAVISHSHADHADGVPFLFGGDRPDPLAVRNYLDSGYDSGGGAPDQVFLRDHAQRYEAIRMEDILWLEGATSAVIDPLPACADGVNPQLRVLWGGLPGDAPSQFSNPNHHSVVLRVDYGEASFLFTGDLQSRQGALDGGGLGWMLDDYERDPSVFDVDALKVSHHGAENGTNDRLLAATTPCLAFMGVGSPDDRGSGTAHDHGHPNRNTLDRLIGAVSGTRPRRDVWAFDGADTEPRKRQLTKALFGTAWDGHYVIYASAAGHWRVLTERGESVPVQCR